MKSAFPLGGVIAGLAAAIGYGLVPLFTLPVNSQAPVLADRMTDSSILFYRFLFATILIGGLMIVTRRDFRVSFKEFSTLTYLAFLSDGSALLLLAGYATLSSGVATTLHFLYPVFTTLIMILFYREARRWSTLLAMAMAVGGVVVLSLNENASAALSGIVFEVLSALCMALYLVYVGRSRVKDMDGVKLTFYVMAIGAFIFGLDALRSGELQPIATQTQWMYLIGVAIVCTVMTNLALVLSVKRIGSTATSVLGALEPLTAVIVGAIVFSEAVTLSTLLGVALVIPAVIIIIYTQKPVETAPKP